MTTKTTTRQNIHPSEILGSILKFLPPTSVSKILSSCQNLPCLYLQYSNLNSVFDLIHIPPKQYPHILKNFNLKSHDFETLRKSKKLNPKYLRKLMQYNKEQISIIILHQNENVTVEGLIDNPAVLLSINEIIGARVPLLGNSELVFKDFTCSKENEFHRVLKICREVATWDIEKYLMRLAHHIRKDVTILTGFSLF